MAQLIDDDLINVYNEIINQNSSNETTKSRKLAIIKHSSAINSLNNRDACSLLKCNLEKISSNILSDADIHQSSTRNNSFQRHFSINNIQADTLISNLSGTCKFVCEKSEHVTEQQYQEFLMLFNNKCSNNTVMEKVSRTFAKSFAPQSCNSKERLLKQTKENMKVPDNIENNTAFDSHNVSVYDIDKSSCFKTAREELNVQNKQGNAYTNTGRPKRKLGARRGIGSKFVSPMLSNESIEDSSSKSQEWTDQVEDDRLKNIEPRMIELIKSEIMDNGPPVDWNDIAGLEFAKTAIQEAVVWPMLRPDIFTGLRRPPKGILLFGPPGTGKTLIGKCVASQSKSTFFSISASSLTSKWVGDGEKMVRALFTVARCHQPAVIFIDEIDSLLSQRSDTEHESSRRIKTEFLVQLDGATTDSDERLLVIGATNRPQELDEAARRRFVKRLYIPLPEIKARQQLVGGLMSNEKNQLDEENIMEIAKLTEGYSGADLRNLCADASMGPIRSIDMSLISSIQTTQVRPVNMDDFRKAIARVKSSVAPNDLEQYIVWNTTYGSGGLY